MSSLTSRPALRWLAPLAFVLAIAGGGLVAVTASADRKLPTRTAEQLLVDLQQARVDGLSGTVVQKADLGIPAIPGVDGADNADLTSLISGTHTLRVNYAAPDKMRVALLSTFGESDVIRDGAHLWTWSSKQNKASHRILSEGERDATPPAEAPTTPEQAAQQVLAALQPTTTVSTDSAVTVAGRAAYELVLDPNDERTLISQVRVAVDGEHKVPLRVQVFGSAGQVVLEVGYTSVSFTRPDDAQFRFNPPPGATVTEDEQVKDPGTAKKPDKAGTAKQRAEAEQARKDMRVVGTGWTAVSVTQLPDGTASGTKLPDGAASGTGRPDGAKRPDSAGDAQLEAFLSKLPKVQGSWGSGRLLAGTAFSAVLTDDGRLAVGAVRPELLYQALAR